LKQGNKKKKEIVLERHFSLSRKKSPQNPIIFSGTPSNWLSEPLKKSERYAPFEGAYNKN
jgi:hypothetical protein